MTSPVLFSVTVPLPNALCHFVKLSPVIFVASFFAYASKSDVFAFPFTVLCNVLNVLLLAKSIFVTSIFVVPLVILVTFVSNSVNSVLFA